MTTFIQRPSDDYSSLWPEYWAQFPEARRAVGADGTEGGDGAAAGAAAAGPGAAAGAGTAGAGAGAAAADAGKGASAAAADWRTGITDPALVEHAKRFNSIDDLVKGNVDLRSQADKLRTTAIVKPGEKATAEEISAYRQKIGVPDKSDEYLKLFPQPEQGKELAPDILALRKTWSDRFHAANVPSDVAAQLVKSFAEDAVAKDKATAEADDRYAKESEATLRREWQGAEYDTNKAYATKAAQQVFGKDFETVRGMEDKTGRFILDNPVMLRMFAKIGREMGEDRLGGTISDTDRGAIDNQITDLRKQQSEAQSSGNSKKANELYQQEQALLAKRNGTRPIVGDRGRAA